MSLFIAMIVGCTTTASSQETYLLSTPDTQNIVTIKDIARRIKFNFRINVDVDSSRYYLDAGKLCGRDCKQLDSIKIQGRTMFVHKGIDMKGLEIINSKADFVFVKGTFLHADIVMSNVKNVLIRNIKSDNINLVNDSLKGLDLVNDTIGELLIMENDIKRLYMNNCKIKNLMILRTQLPDSVILHNTANHYSQENPLDLTLFENTDRKTSLLEIPFSDIPRIKFNYIDVQLALPTDELYRSLGKENFFKQNIMPFKHRMYRELLAQQQYFGFSDGYAKADKEFKAFQYATQGTTYAYLVNLVEKYWWDYGYNKGLIWRNTVYLFLMFSIINIVLYKRLILETYRIDEVVRADQRLNTERLTTFEKKVKKIVNCFLFTAFVFFSLKLDYERIKLNSFLLAGLIIFECIVGLACITNIAAFFFTK
ncbi:hypothetical protein EXU57_24100 [Segetibacter sp. 3557_3]|uniref:hypothetical protein n=1 Tax=Segetibacter sp. 3557_3 TaxID=2547429 RepID=UPI001058CB9C|nr:hypothetical protein [Segetibacter sp. 3557_3]TDH18264.1 hypothetical protein EXU57_24100 [Segetibacter sp. 3557_3]